MKAALVGPIYPYRGGIAHYTAKLYRELIARGHEVALYSFKRQYPRWLFPGQTDRDPSALKLDAACEYTLDSLNPFTWWATARAIRARRPDALILQWWVPFFAPMWAVLARVARRAGIKVTFICHNVLPHEQRPWDVWLTRKTLGLGDGFVVHSQEEKARLLALLPGRQAEAMPLPVFDMLADQTLARDEARQRLGLPQGAPVLLFFGFVREYKGLRYLLEAMPAIRAELAEVRLLIVGEFWQDKQSYQEQIKRLGIEQSVTIVDQYVSNEEMPVYFAAADVAVLPYTHVTQSAVAQLAFGFGVPVITTRVGGLPEAIVEGETGLLVEPQDARGLAKAITHYFETTGFEQRLRENIQRQPGRKGWEQLCCALERLAGSDYA
jgi:glycosyltransferase involved in cell wall biosynthesis